MRTEGTLTRRRRGPAAKRRGLPLHRLGLLAVAGLALGAIASGPGAGPGDGVLTDSGNVAGLVRFRVTLSQPDRRNLFVFL